MNERRNDLEIVIVTRELLRRSQTRIDLLFTMSEIPHARPVKDDACEVMFRGRLLLAIGLSINGQPVFALQASPGTLRLYPAWLRHAKPKGRSVVEPDGIEPTTSCLQSTRSPS
jgi:hypothetical protein